MQRGEIWWTDFGEPRGSEPGFYRPAVVISTDRFNSVSLNTATVVICTTNINLAKRPGNVLLPIRGTGLDHPSVVNVTQVATIDRRALDRFIGRVPNGLMTQIDDGLRLALAL